MKCKQAQPNLLEYSRGRLSPREAEALRGHLDGCAGCRMALDAEVQLAGKLSALPQVESQSNVWPVVQVGIGPARRQVSLLGWLRETYARRVAVAAAAVAVLVVAVFSFTAWRSSSSEKESIAKAAALMRVQPVTDNRVAAWPDDPLAPTTDRMIQVLEDEL